MPADYGIAGMGRYKAPSVARSTPTIGKPSGTSVSISPVYKPPAVKTAVSRYNRSMGGGRGVRSKSKGKNVMQYRAPKAPTRRISKAPNGGVPNFLGNATQSSYNTLRAQGRRPGPGIVKPIGNATSQAARKIGSSVGSVGKSFGDAWAGSNPINILYRQIGERLKDPSRRR